MHQETVHRAWMWPGCGLDVAWTFACTEKSFGSCGVFVNITKQYTCERRLAARPGRSEQPVVQVGLRRCTGVTGDCR